MRSPFILLDVLREQVFLWNRITWVLLRVCVSFSESVVQDHFPCVKLYYSQWSEHLWLLISKQMSSILMRCTHYIISVNVSLRLTLLQAYHSNNWDKTGRQTNKHPSNRLQSHPKPSSFDRLEAEKLLLKVEKQSSPPFLCRLPSRHCDHILISCFIQSSCALIRFEASLFTPHEVTGWEKKEAGEVI